jgi:hypothetical protein
MPAVTITPADLATFNPTANIPDAKAQLLIDGAIGQAMLVAPCIAEADFAHEDAAKLLLIQAILRWHEAGTGAAVQLQAGPYGQSLDTRVPRRAVFWPSEIRDLRAMCSTGDAGAWSYDRLASSSIIHADICSINLGGQYCSCGAILTLADPLYERGG